MKKLIKKFRNWRTKRFIKKLKNACLSMDGNDILYINCNLRAKGMITSKIERDKSQSIKKNKNKNG